MDSLVNTIFLISVDGDFFIILVELLVYRDRVLEPYDFFSLLFDLSLRMSHFIFCYAFFFHLSTCTLIPNALLQPSYYHLYTYVLEFICVHGIYILKSISLEETIDGFRPYSHHNFFHFISHIFIQCALNIVSYLLTLYQSDSPMFNFK